MSSPTHFSPNGDSSLLDLILTSNSDIFRSLNTFPPLGKSDHAVVHCVLAYRPSRSSPGRLRRISGFDKADFAQVNHLLLSADWSLITSAPDMDVAWEAWKSVFFNIVSAKVPSKYIAKVRPKPAWMSSTLEQAIHAKRALFRRWKRQRTPESWRLFVTKRNEVTKALWKAEYRYIQSLHRNADNAPTSPDPVKEFWSFIKRSTGKQKSQQIPDLSATTIGSSTPATSDYAKANMLNTFFAAQTDLPGRDQPVPPLPSASSDSDLSDFIVTPFDVYQALLSLKPGKACGPDDIPPLLLRLCAKGIAAPLCSLFQRSLLDGKLPSQWKTAHVVPVFKAGDRNNPTNYRPISLLCIVSKVLEKLLYRQLYDHLESILSPQQSGFRRKDGTQFQLLRLVQQWSEAIDASTYVGVIFFDLKKAFDRVWHRGLLAKLESAGVKGRALQWLTDFLHHRHQQVRVGNSLSAVTSLHAGVPQGAVLSPLLFLLYVNDATSAPTDANVNLFADDTSIFMCDKCPTRLVQRMQVAVDDMSAWFRRWLLTVNTSKSCLMILRSRGMTPISASVSMNDQPLLQVPTHKHLGVTFHHLLTWSDHVAMIVNRASSKLGLLHRLHRSLPRLTIRRIYMTCIRPSLEYAAVAWSALSAGDAARLESVQRRAARLITGLPRSSDTPHDILLARAGLSSLSSRREGFLGRFAAQCINHLIPSHIRDSFPSWFALPKPARCRSLRNSSAVRLPRAKKTYLKKSPFYLSFALWNSLPARIVSGSFAAVAFYLKNTFS